MTLPKYNKLSEDMGKVVTSLNTYTGQELYSALSGFSWFTLETIIKTYCKSNTYHNNTIHYLMHYCLTKSYYLQYSTSKVKGHNQGSIHIQGKISGMIEQISSDMMSLLLRKGNWEKDDYSIINNICSKLHSVYRLAKCIDQFGEGGSSISHILDTIEDVWIDVIYITIDDFMNKITKNQIHNETITYQCKDRSIHKNHENKYIIKYGKQYKIDTNSIYHYYKIKLGSEVSDELIEHKIIDLIREIIHQKKHNKSQIISLIKNYITK